MTQDASRNASAVLVAGSANLDFVVLASHIPAPGETVLGSDFATYPGGKGANQAVACARAGAASTRMLLALGDDAFAAPIEASLRGAGVALEIVRVPDHPTGLAFVCVSHRGENAITVAPGANEHLLPEHLPALSGVSHLLLQLETPLVCIEAWTHVARAAGVVVVLNAAPARVLPTSLLRAVDLLVVNEGELELLSGVQGDVAGAIAALDVANVVVTLGMRGCCASIGGKVLLQPAFETTPVDTTGAGDTFCGTLVAAMAQGEPFALALRRASAAASLACSRIGAQAGVPMRDEVDQLLDATLPSVTLDALATYCGFA